MAIRPADSIYAAPRDRLPHVRGLPLVGALPAFLRQPFDFLLDARTRYDDNYTLNLGPARLIVLVAGLLLLAACGGGPGAGAPVPTTGSAETPIAAVSPTPGGTTPVPETQPTLAPAPTTDDLLEQAYAQLREGQLAFNPPQEMRLGDSTVVRLRLTRYGNVAAPTLVAGLDSDRQVLTDMVKVGSTMRAQLTGDTFEVEPLSSEEQLVVGDDYNEWAWRVAPQAGGTHALTLRISAVITVGSEKMSRDFPVKETTVAVQVGFMQVIGRALGENWKELLGLLVPTGSGAIGVWAWQKLGRKRGKRAASAR